MRETVLVSVSRARKATTLIQSSLLFLYRSVDMDHDKDKVKNHFHYIHPYYCISSLSFKIINIQCTRDVVLPQK